MKIIQIIPIIITHGEIGRSSDLPGSSYTQARSDRPERSPQGRILDTHLPAWSSIRRLGRQDRWPRDHYTCTSSACQTLVDIGLFSQLPTDCPIGRHTGPRPYSGRQGHLDNIVRICERKRDIVEDRHNFIPVDSPPLDFSVVV